MNTVDPALIGHHSGSFTIQEWCQFRRVSIAMYYKLRSEGKAPRTLAAGRRQTITAEADRDWVRKNQSD